MSSSKLEEEASTIVSSSDDTWVALIKFLLQKISDQNVNKVGAANAPFVFSPQVYLEV